MSKIRNRSTSGSSKSSHKEERRYDGGQQKMSEESTTEDEAEISMMQEIERAFEKALDAKFGRFEQRMIEIEEKSEKVFKLIQERSTNVKEELNYQSGSDESTYRALVDLMEQNNEETKRTTKQLETLNTKQNDLMKNTQELVERTSRLQKMVKTLQNKGLPVTSIQQNQEKIHSVDQQDRLSSESKDEISVNHRVPNAHIIEETYEKA